MTDYKLAPKRCAACGNAKPVSEMKICMHNQMHRYVCDLKCMIDFYNPPKNAAAPAVQGEPVASAPVAAQQRFRHPQKSTPDWSPWQSASINLDRPSWEIDSQGYEVEYRLLYDAPQPTKQPTFTVGTDLSDGKLSVVVLKHENGITQVIHSEAIQLEEQHINVTPDLKVLKEMLEEARHHVDSPPITMVKTVRGGFIQEIDAILKLLHKGSKP